MLDLVFATSVQTSRENDKLVVTFVIDEPLDANGFLVFVAQPALAAHEDAAAGVGRGRGQAEDA